MAAMTGPPSPPSDPADLSVLAIRPIGVVRSPFLDKMSTPRQPAAARDVTGTIELFRRPGMEHAVHDLEGCDHLWVIFWFHLVEGFRPKVLPPRSPGKRRGVLATRSPHRPNPIGLSVVRLDRIDGLTLHIRDIDMVDGTPVLDVKPYVPYTDSVPHARVAWLTPLCSEEGGPAAVDPEPGFEVSFEGQAAEALAFLRTTFGIELAAPITGVLSLGPQPHPYRRIRKVEEGFLLAVKEWRARFVVAGRRICVTRIESGYRPKQLAAPGDAALDPHRALWERFGERFGEGAPPR
jgi:tRNA-Thr(GGU) m(6)t(6)A37 methyltransferase TsaA